MKKKIFALLTVCMMIMNICGITGVRAEENLIFATDFDSYTIGTGEKINTAFTTLPYAEDKVIANDNGTEMTGAQLDEEHGTSLKFSEGDWRNMSFVMPEECSSPVLVSFDFNMSGMGQIKMLSNNGQGYGGYFAGTTYYAGLDMNSPQGQLETAITVGEWAHIEIYNDSSEGKFIFYINGKPIGKYNTESNSTSALSLVQFQKMNGGEMYIDNMKVEKVTSAPLSGNIIATASNKVNVISEGVKVKFSAGVKTDTLTTENIKVFDVENNSYLSGVTLENVAADSVDVKFGEKLTVGKSYRIELANIKGTIDQNVETTQIPFEVFEGEKDLIFKTDFDSYCIADEYPVQSVFTALPYAEDKVIANDNGTEMTGAQLDEEHGTSLKFSEGDWRNMSFVMPEECSSPVLVSFDFNMSGMGQIKMLSNNGQGYGGYFAGTTYYAGLDMNSPQGQLETAITVGEWAHIEIYNDSSEGKFIFYINGKPIGKYNTESNSTSALSLVQFQKMNGGEMYIDNMKVEKVTSAPLSGNIIATASNKVNVISEGVKVKFSAGVKTDTLTTENIKVFDVENNSYLSGVTLENVAADSVDVKFGEKLTVGKSYRIELANIKGTIDQNVETTQIPFEVFEGDKNLIFRTDFDSYCITDGYPVQSVFTSLPYANDTILANSENAKTAVNGLHYDEKYNTVMEFGNADWQNIDIVLPSACTEIIKVSFDFNMNEEGTMRALGNNANNYGAVFSGTDVILGCDYEDKPIAKENAIKLNEWNTVEFYIDNENKTYCLLLNGEPIGDMISLEGEKTPLEFVQFHKISEEGVMYVDNIEVTKASEMPAGDNTMLKFTDDANNVTAKYNAGKEARVYVAAYNSSGVLLNVVSEEGVSGSVVMPKNADAVQYKAFLWDKNNAPLCGAKSL